MTALSLTELSTFAAQFPIQYLNGAQDCRVAYRHIHHYPLSSKFLVLVNGRAENILKWTELAQAFYQQGFDVLLLDHRGQGYSERLLAESEKGYVEDFSFYAADMAKIIENLTALYPYPNQYLLAHSMGALISAHYLADYPHQIKSAVFSSPFFAIPYKSPRRDQWLVKLMLKLKKGERYVFGKGAFQPVNPLENKLSHDAARMKLMNDIHSTYPELRLGGPTFHWLDQCQRAIALLPEKLAHIQLPVLVLQAEKEQIVENKNLAKLTALLPQAQLKLARESKHEILFEREDIRDWALSEILAWFNSPAISTTPRQAE